LDPDASRAAQLGAEIRSRRQARGLTLGALAALIGFSSQHISEVERAKAPVSGPFVAACDRALHARGLLLALLPAVLYERATDRHERSAQRRRDDGHEAPVEDHSALAAVMRTVDAPTAVPWARQPGAREDVDPISRRSLLGVGVGAALGLNATTASAARDIDPELAGRWMELLRVLVRHDAMFGAHDVLATVRHPLELISEQRHVARGEIRTRLLRVESRWSWFAAWLGNDAGDWNARDALADRSLGLAREAGDHDAAAWSLLWQSRWAANRTDPHGALQLADAARRTAGATDHVRGLCALKQASGHALVRDMAACERRLADAHDLLDAQPTERTTPWEDLGRQDASRPFVMADEARCWMQMRPRRAIGMYERVLGSWPRDRARGRGLHQARLALACAAAGDMDRAAVEGTEALATARTTRSDMTVRELRRLDRRLEACDAPVAADFRDALATL
jgi:transcriptional regulator with XRE-family HTH domain